MSWRVFTCYLLVATVWWGQAAAASSIAVQRRVDRDIRDGNPLVVHAIVALCDNDHQGIVPVSRELGDGENPRTNLYWGALYGVRTFLTKKARWKLLTVSEGPHASILERIVLVREVHRAGSRHEVYLVADAWRGKDIKAATVKFLEIAYGTQLETLELQHSDRVMILAIGGSAHVVVYLGHNGLMDFSLPILRSGQRETPARSSIVLACVSWPYFNKHILASGSYPLLLTTGLMAPEAYTLDAAIDAWFSGRKPEAVVEAAALAYDRYQKCGIEGARRLFRTAPH